ncbi:MAG: histidine kinase [Rhodocyclales bacterium]|nr:histidine kinase [Rhodocyclales bacterium]
MAAFVAPKGCLAMRVDLARPEMTVVASRGETEHPVGSLVGDEDNLLGHAVGTLKPAASSDLPEPVGGAPCACGSGGSALCWPLTMDKQVIGALCVRRLPEQPSLTAADIERGATLIAFLSVIIDNARLHEEQHRRIEELSRANAEVQAVNRRLEDAQNQLLQSEKMASIGQLAAGVAHEINNPIGYVHSNLGSLETYVEDLFRILDAYAEAQRQNPAPAACFAEVAALRERLDIDFLKQDVHALLAETREGIDRVKKIVQDLKDFSRAGAEDEWHWADLHKGLDSTLNIVNNEIKYKAKVVKEYGTLPEIDCLPSQLNQVFMNLLVNAAHAIEGQGVITVRTGTEGGKVWIEIADSGCGIPEENLPRIFEPFFTTKPVGRGTGLGLSLSYSIVQKHGGRIEVASEPGQGTTFRITLPRERVAEAA